MGKVEDESFAELVRAFREYEHVREPVKWFSRQMEKKLKTHDHDRGMEGWLKSTTGSLFDALVKEEKELVQALLNTKTTDADTLNTLYRRVIEECVDIANFALFIADLHRKMITDGRTNIETTEENK